MVDFDRSKAIILLIIVSMILFAAVVIADLGSTYSYILLVWLIVVMLIGVVSYGIEKR